MGEPGVLKKIKSFIAYVAFRVFIWGVDLTQEAYWKLIHDQEKLR